MTFDYALAKKMRLNNEETKMLKSFKTPDDFQNHIMTKKYNYKDVFHSFRQAVCAEEINCFGGAMMGAAYIYFNRLGPPMIICMEAGYNNSDHNVAVYFIDGKIGSITASRSEKLMGRSAIFDSYADLVLSYFPDYNSDSTDSTGTTTLRGFCAPVDLRMFGDGWLHASDSLTEIESYLYSVPYQKLFPHRPEIYADTFPAGGNFYYFPLTRSESAKEMYEKRTVGVGGRLTKSSGRHL